MHVFLRSCHSQATIHLYDLLKKMYGNKLIPMMVKDKKIADVDLEYVFRYGALGYGYSHQLKQSDQSISHTLKESMFFNGKQNSSVLNIEQNVIIRLPIMQSKMRQCKKMLNDFNTETFKKSLKLAIFTTPFLM